MTRFDNEQVEIILKNARSVSQTQCQHQVKQASTCEKQTQTYWMNL